MRQFRVRSVGFSELQLQVWASMPVTWLHISDIHLKADGAYDRNVVLSALIRAVRHFRERESRAPDVIFATGDIAYSGQSGEYAVATQFFDQR